MHGHLRCVMQYRVGLQISIRPRWSMKLLLAGKEVEVVWTCDEKRGTLRRNEGDGNESTGEKEERKT